MRTVATFTLIYIILPSISVFLSIQSYLPQSALTSIENSGLEQAVLMVPFYFYAAGSVHFHYTNRGFLKLGLLRDLSMRLLTWDVPCQAWIMSAIYLQGILFARVGPSLWGLLVSMMIVFPFMAIIVAGVSFFVLRQTAPTSALSIEMDALANRPTS